MKLSIMEIMVVLIVALLVLGPDKLPLYAQKLGAALKEFRKFSSDATKDIRESIVEPLEEAQRPLKDAMEPITDLTKEIKADVEDVKKAFTDLGKPETKKAPTEEPTAQEEIPTREPTQVPQGKAAPFGTEAPPAETGSEGPEETQVS